MSHRLNLFFAGLSGKTPTIFIETGKLCDALCSDENENVRQCIERYKRNRENLLDECMSRINTARSIASFFNVEVNDPPADDRYEEWLAHFVQRMEERFQMNHISHYYFYYGRRMAEFICKLHISKAYFELLAHEQRPAFRNTLSRHLYDAEYILFKLIAPAALLSSEHGHRYFNTFYQETNKSFEPFRNPDLEKLDKEQCLLMSGSIERYTCTVNDGLGKCLSVLKELADN